VKLLLSLLLCACLTEGCVAGSEISHADSPGSQKSDDGPTLCRDGTAPPCNERS
jgi:hypothetical protein